MQKILLDEMGLNYICATAERFFAVCGFWVPHGWVGGRGWLSLDQLPPTHPKKQVSTVLSNMVQTLIEVPSVRLLKHIVRCYLRLSENPRCVIYCDDVLGRAPNKEGLDRRMEHSRKTPNHTKPDPNSPHRFDPHIYVYHIYVYAYHIYVYVYHMYMYTYTTARGTPSGSASPTRCAPT